MPVYEYECEKCGNVTEALRKMAEADAPQPCESCGSEKTHRIRSVFTATASAREVSLPTGPGCACGNPHGPCNM